MNTLAIIFIILFLFFGIGRMLRQASWYFERGIDGILGGFFKIFIIIFMFGFIVYAIASCVKSII